MKLNFWQIIGGLLLLVGIVALIIRETGSSDTKPTPPAPVEIPEPATTLGT